MLTRAEDYLFVRPDEDAMQGGRFPFSGAIYPRRTGDAKKRLSYEDICFLQEACGELNTVIRYFSGASMQKFPYGQTGLGPVPRPLYGRAVGRFGPDIRDKEEGASENTGLSSGEWTFHKHFPSSTAYIKSFLDQVGNDALKLFGSYSTTNPKTGHNLSDLTSYECETGHVAEGDGGYSFDTNNGAVYFDVFYSLLLFAGSLDALQIPTKPRLVIGQPAASFPSYDAAVTLLLNEDTPFYENEDALNYSELMFNGGFAYFGVSNGLGVFGNRAFAFVNPSATISGNKQVCHLTYQVDTSIDHDYKVSSIQSGGTTVTAAEYDSDNEYKIANVKNGDQPYRHKIFGAVQTLVLGSGGFAGFRTGWQSLVNINITDLAESKVVGPEMLAVLWGLPGKCTKVYIPEMEPKRHLDSGQYYNCTELSGGRQATYSANYWQGESLHLTSDSGPVQPQGAQMTAYPSAWFSKSIHGYNTMSWETPRDEHADYGPLELSYQSTYTNYSVREITIGPLDNRVYLTVGGAEGSSTQSAWKALVDESKGVILGNIDAVVLVSVTHRLESYRRYYGPHGEHEEGWPEETKDTKTFAISYTLTNPRMRDGDDTIYWTPSMSDNEIIDKALELYGMSRSSVFDNTYLTRTQELPSADQDSRMPSAPTPPSANPDKEHLSASFEAEFTETLTVELGLVLPEDNHYYVHVGLASVSPRTADQ